MSKFHSTISRRDFMKALGLAGAGLGAATATAPVFHDLDELTTSYSNFKYPWWIKEVDEPTVPLDWSLIDMKQPLARYRTDAPINEYRFQRRKGGMTQSLPGDSLKDYSIISATRKYGKRMDSWIGPEPYYDHTDYGIPAYSGNPDDNLKMLRAATHYFGTPRLGVRENSPSTYRKLYGKGIEWDSSAPKAFEKDDRTKVIPSSVRYTICWPVLQLPQIARCTKEPIDDPSDPRDGYPPFLGKATTYCGYSDVDAIQYKISRFLRTLGREGLALGGLPVAWGPLTVAEYCRAGMACSPEYGMAIRKTDIMATDLELPPTKFIDGGVHKFCEKCYRCAENCPSSSLELNSGPAEDPWGIKLSEDGQELNRPGVGSWKVQWSTCIEYGAPRDCHICQWSCPFNHASDPASIHQMVAATIGTTPIFNSFFATMDRQFDYAKQMDPEDWWNRDLNNWEHDTICGRGSGKNL